LLFEDFLFVAVVLTVPGGKTFQGLHFTSYKISVTIFSRPENSSQDRNFILDEEEKKSVNSFSSLFRNILLQHF